ncbi:uncharacterized protein LOC131666862 [Phymastichus coffea]|uniref:uncharacterized protein LOC131666862 n=1 Tax=Phymastichus coffea TaxID=108790 RepID=UPI00273CA7AB|nr:uncharacterized protein LOC131666862 [Phymastichus coffea]
MENKEDRVRQKMEELRQAEKLMNRVYGELDALQKEEEILTYEDVLRLENKENEEREDGELLEREIKMADNEPIEEETMAALGENPISENNKEFLIIKTVADRLKVWSSKGISNKEEKLKLISKIPRRNNEINLEAPKLNEEIAVNLTQKALTKDGFFREYQELAGASLAAAATALSMIINDRVEPLERDNLLENLGGAVKLMSDLFYQLSNARKLFIMGRYNENIQRIAKNRESTSLLFGDEFKTVLENAKAMERAVQELKPKNTYNRPPFSSYNNNAKNSLNWRSSPFNRGSRGSYKNQYQNHRSGSNTHSSTYTSSRRSEPTKRFYNQSQPYQHRRR